MKKPKNYTHGSKVPRVELVPMAALLSLAARYEQDEVQHKARAWNGISANQEAADDVAFVTARLGHVVNHAYRALAILNGIIPDDGDDHAGAIMWGGSLLAVHNERKPKKQEGKAK